MSPQLTLIYPFVQATGIIKSYSIQHKILKTNVLVNFAATLLAAWKHTWQITRRLARWWQQIIEIQVQQIISQTIIGVGRNCFLCLLLPSIHNFFNDHMNVSRTKSLLGSSSWHCWRVRANSIPHMIFYLNTKSRFHVALKWLCKQRIAPLIVLEIKYCLYPWQYYTEHTTIIESNFCLKK